MLWAGTGEGMAMRTWRRHRPVWIGLRRRTAGVVVALLAVAGGTAIASGPAPAAGRPLDAWAEPPGLDAGGYAPEAVAALQRDLHIGAADLRQRRAAEKSAYGIERILRARLGPRFAGVWLSKDGKRVVAGVASAADVAAVRAAGAEPAVVRYTESQLDGARRLLDRQATEAPEHVHGWYADPRQGGVVVLVTAGQRSVAEAFAAAAGVDIAVLRVEDVDTPPRPMYDLRGGDPYYSVKGTCSAGFAVDGGFVTAGHCAPAKGNVLFAGPNYFPLGVFGGATFPGQDGGWVKSYFAWSMLPEVAGLGSVAGSQEAAVGSSVCRSGTSSGVRCGVITAKNVTMPYDEGPVFGLTRTTACAKKGDSGGPFLSGNQAQGVLSGGDDKCEPGTGDSTFQPVNPILAEYHLSLKTVTDPAAGAWWNRMPYAGERTGFFTDVDRDGLDDILAFFDFGDGQTTLWVSLAKGGGEFAPPTLEWDSGRGTWDMARSRFVVGDFTGDEEADVGVFYDYGDAHTRLFVFRATAAGHFADPVLKWDSGPGNWNLGSTRLVAGEFTGDYWADIAAFYDDGGGQTRLFVFASDRRWGFHNPVVKWDSGPGNWNLASSRLVVGEFTGDRQADIAVFYDYGQAQTRLFLFAAEGAGDFAAPVVRWDSGPGNWDLGSSRVVAGDFTGDNRADIGAFYDYGGAHARLFVFAAAGAGDFAAPVVRWDSGPGNWSVASSRFMAGRFVEDGPADIAALYDYGDYQTGLFLFQTQTGGEVRAPVLKWDSGVGNWNAVATAPL